jgi:hypothetical protein
MDTFAECARKHFSFLTADYGFSQGTQTSILPELGDSPYSVRYDAPHIFIWVHLDKNEVLVAIFVKVHTSILRPSGKRMFNLADILRHSAPDWFKFFPKSETPDTAPGNFEAFLRFYAEGLNRYCGDLLRMDLKQLEEISQPS